MQKSKNYRLKNLLHEVENTLMPEQNRAVKKAHQVILLLEDHGFTLTKGEFRDPLALHCNKTLRSLPSNCPCGQKFNVTHVLNCKKGGFMTMRHNNIRDFEANLLRIVHNDIEVEPQLQQVDNEQFFIRDMRVTNVNSDSQKNMPVEKILSSTSRIRKEVITG